MSINSVYKKIEYCASNYPDLVFVLVDNGSTDNTHSRFARLKESNIFSNIFFVSVGKNMGYGFGIKSAFDFIRSPYFGWTHGDGQTDIFDIIRCLDFLYKSDSVSSLNRATFSLKGVRYARPMADSIISFLMSLIASVLHFPLFLSEINAQPSIYHSSLLDYIEDAPDDYNFDAFMFIQSRRLRMSLIRLPVLFPERQFGVSSWNTSLVAKVSFMFNQFCFLINMRLR